MFYSMAGDKHGVSPQNCIVNLLVNLAAVEFSVGFVNGLVAVFLLLL